MSSKVVAIHGRAGAGKSTLGARIAQRLDDVPIIHADDFASGEDQTPSGDRLLDQVLRPLARQQAARYQRYDWDVGRLAEWHEIQAGGYVVLEGVTTIQTRFRPSLALTVWVSTAREECFRRGLQRDGLDADGEWREWQAIEDAYIAREAPQRTADLVVSGEHGEPWRGPGRPDKTREDDLAS